MISERYYHLSRQADTELTPAGPNIKLNVHNFQDTTVDIVLLVLTTTFVGLRFYARRLQNIRYGPEDWTILGALSKSLSSTYISEYRLLRFSAAV
ncbi:hypothetical protein CJF31_00003496 [Rutstroemia sp. NJR-2017a BVV2]|nr:hypothetical protein CJF31_00003496 [Rutstroemia sp. NJR-2017a BVV2]